MQQSRIHIRVKNASDWEKLFSLEIYGFNICATGREEFGNIKGLDYIIENNWGLREDRLKMFVEKVYERLGENAIIIADTTNEKLHPRNYCVYYLGDRVVAGYFFDIDDMEEEFDESLYYPREANMFFSTKIKNIRKWTDFGAVRLNKKEKKFVEAFLRKKTEKDTKEQ